MGRAVRLCKWLPVLTVCGGNKCLHIYVLCVGRGEAGGGETTNVCKTVTELKVAFRYFFAFSHSEDPKNATDDV